MLDVSLMMQITGENKFLEILMKLRERGHTTTYQILSVLQAISVSMPFLLKQISGFMRIAFILSYKMSIDNIGISAARIVNLFKDTVGNGESENIHITLEELGMLLTGEPYRPLGSSFEEDFVKSLLDVGFKCVGDGKYSYNFASGLTPEDLKILKEISILTIKEIEAMPPQPLPTDALAKLQAIKDKVKQLSELERSKLAPKAPLDLLRMLLEDENPNVIIAALQNNRITEREELMLALNKETSPKVLEYLIKNGKFSKKYPIKLALCNNPFTPELQIRSLINNLMTHDLVRLSANFDISGNRRQIAKKVLRRKIAEMPASEKAQLAEIASQTLIQILFEDRHDAVLKGLLKNPHLNEQKILILAQRPSTSAIILSEICKNRTWTNNRSIKMALLSNNHTPLNPVKRLLRTLARHELQQVSRRDNYAPQVRKAAKELLLKRKK